MAECASLQATHYVARSAFEANLQWALLGSMSLSEARQPPGLACGQRLINDPPVGASEPFPARGGSVTREMDDGNRSACLPGLLEMQEPDANHRVWFNGIMSFRVTVCSHSNHITDWL